MYMYMLDEIEIKVNRKIGSWKNYLRLQLSR